MTDVENLRIAVFDSLKLGYIEIIGEWLKDIEADIDIITESYGIDNLPSSSRDETLEGLNTLYHTFKKEFDDFECTITSKK